MNIVEAFKIAKEQGKRVRPVGVNWCVAYEDDFISGFFTRNNRLTKVWNGGGEYLASPEEILKDWEVVEEKPSKQTQHKIDSMKFQIVRYCDENADCDDCYDCEIRRICHTKPYSPLRMLLDDWSLKDIVEAYHILKEAGEI